VTTTPVTLAGPGRAGPAPAPPAAADARHLERLQALCPGAQAAAAPGRGRGSAWQQPRRWLEQQVRQEGAAFRQWAAAHGLNRVEAAGCLGIAARTLRAWEQRPRPAPAAAAPRGRPVLRSDRAARAAVLELLEGVGPGAGLAVLAGQFPDLPKAELGDLLKRYRRAWARRHPRLLHVLHWQRPGSVWAADYARPPLPLEEGFTDLLAVRDLASGLQLLWLPVAEAAAAASASAAALLSLFLLYGAPLVLKLDNGAPFVAEALRALLAALQVLPLYSPPGCPPYNGAIEAGIGALKVRTHYQAVRQGRPGEWTSGRWKTPRRPASRRTRSAGPGAPTARRRRSAGPAVRRSPRPSARPSPRAWRPWRRTRPRRRPRRARPPPRHGHRRPGQRPRPPPPRTPCRRPGPARRPSPGRPRARRPRPPTPPFPRRRRAAEERHYRRPPPGPLGDVRLSVVRSWRTAISGLRGGEFPHPFGRKK
jgi:hypothetical protein